MTPITNPKSQVANPPESLPLSLLNDVLYCPRRAALKIVEGWREANEHTALGDIVHEHADLPGYESQISNAKSQIILLRALPVWSERLGLTGKCDIVEAELRSNSRSEISNLKSGGMVALVPVEYKKGRRRRFANDDAQLCAQALCLEEMFNLSIPRGAVFHAESKRRRQVEFTPELRALVEQSVEDLHALLRQSEISNFKSEIPRLPPAVFKPACKECSLFDICLPRLTRSEAEAANAKAARALFQI